MQTGLDPSTLTPHQRRELIAALAAGGRFLDSLVEQRLDAVQREAGAAATDPTGDPERLLAALQPFIDEVGHLRYLREQLELLPARCAAAGG